MKPVKLNKLTKGFSNKQVWINGPYLSNGAWIVPASLVLYYPNEVEERDFDYQVLLDDYYSTDNRRIRITTTDLILQQQSDYIRLWTDSYNNIICGANDAFCQTVMDNFQPDSVHYSPKQRFIVFDFTGDDLHPTILMPYDLSAANDYLKTIRWEI